MKTRPRIILGIETSCDDTSVAILRGETTIDSLDVLSQSQDEVLKKWGGVVPEIAAREHVKMLPLLIEQILERQDLKLTELTEIAVTTTPGLIGPLLSGLQSAKTLSLALQIPIQPVHHLRAHLEAIHLTEKVAYPYLGLLVSGGNSLLVEVKNSQTFQVHGQTLDDAAGEAFDKGGKLMGLGYPAGRVIDELAKEGIIKTHHFTLSRLKDRPGKMSFSGLKTALRVLLQNQPQLLNDEKSKKDLCASYQEAIVQTLLLKTKEVQNTFQLSHLPLVVAGGVACNSRLRSVFLNQWKNVHFVAPRFCTDNAGMIANYAFINPELSLSYPDCLKLDAAGNTPL